MPRNPFRPRDLFRHGRLTPTLATAALLIGMVTAAPAAAAPKNPASGAAVDVYAADLTRDQVRVLNRSALDREDVRVTKSAKKDLVHVEAVLSGTEAAALNRLGLGLTVKKVDGKDARQRSLAAAPKVFRPYSGPGNIREELLKVAAGHPSIATAVDIGKSGEGQPITAVRVTKDVRRTSTTSGPSSSTRPPSTPASGSLRRWSAGCCTTTSAATARTPGSPRSSTRRSCGSSRW